MYFRGIELNNNITLDADFKLQIFTDVSADIEGHQSDFQDYRLTASKEQEINIDKSDVEVVWPVKKLPIYKPRHFH
jgi:Fic family protein